VLRPTPIRDRITRLHALLQIATKPKPGLATDESPSPLPAVLTGSHSKNETRKQREAADHNRGHLSYAGVAPADVRHLVGDHSPCPYACARASEHPGIGTLGLTRRQLQAEPIQNSNARGETNVGQTEVVATRNFRASRCFSTRASTSRICCRICCRRSGSNVRQPFFVYGDRFGRCQEDVVAVVFPQSHLGAAQGVARHQGRLGKAAFQGLIHHRGLVDDGPLVDNFSLLSEFSVGTTARASASNSEFFTTTRSIISKSSPSSLTTSSANADARRLSGS
jgi:hypothetical protein